LKIVFVYDNSILNQYRVQWRCRNIANAINRTGLHHADLMDIPAFVSDTEECQRVCSEADLIIIHQFGIGTVLKTALSWKTLKKKIVLDIDVALNLIDEDMDLYPLWIKGEVPPGFAGCPSDSLCVDPTPLQQLKWATSHFDAITVSSERLAGDWERFGKVFLVPDFIDTDQYLPLKTHPDGEIWFGMGGGPLSGKTFENSGLLQAVEEVCQQKPNTRLFIGNLPSPLIEKLRVPPEQRIIYSWMPPEDWRGCISNLDLGLAPSLTQYDFRESRKPVLEYLSLKIPWVASDHLPFRDIKQYGMVVENSYIAWKNGILQSINCLEERTTFASGNPYLYAISQDIDENINKIIDSYEMIIRD